MEKKTTAELHALMAEHLDPVLLKLRIEGLHVVAIAANASNISGDAVVTATLGASQEEALALLKTGVRAMGNVLPAEVSQPAHGARGDLETGLTHTPETCGLADLNCANDSPSEVSQSTHGPQGEPASLDAVAGHETPGLSDFSEVSP